jgi:hypothetical protein
MYQVSLIGYNEYLAGYLSDNLKKNNLNSPVYSASTKGINQGDERAYELPFNNEQ